MCYRMTYQHDYAAALKTPHDFLKNMGANFNKIIKNGFKWDTMSCFKCFEDKAVLSI